MKKKINTISAFVVILVSMLFVISMGCSSEQITPANSEKIERIEPRTGCTEFGELVRERVSERDHIPLEEISICTYYGPYFGGYCEYRCTTSVYGTPVYIIGDDSEGW